MVTAKKAAIGLTATAGIIGLLWSGYGLIERLKGSLDQLRVSASLPKFGKPTIDGLPVTVPVSIDNKSTIQIAINNLYVTLIGIPASGPTSEIAVSSQIASIIIRANANNSFPVSMNLGWLSAVSAIMNKGYSKIRIRTYFEYKGVPQTIDYDYDTAAMKQQILAAAGQFKAFISQPKKQAGAAQVGRVVVSGFQGATPSNNNLTRLY